MSLLNIQPTEQPTEVPTALVNEWADQKRALSAAKDLENHMRLGIVNTFFAKAKSEGSSTMKVADGRKIAATKVLNRTVDVELLQVMSKEFVEKGIPVDTLIKYRPEVVISVYRELTEEQRMFFDQVLTITDGTPQLELRTPKNWTPPNE